MLITRLYRIALLALVAGVVVWSCKSSKIVDPRLPAPPSAPHWLNVVPNSVTRTSVQLTWDATSTDQDGFRIYMTQDTTGFWSVVDSVFTRVGSQWIATIDGLQPATTYYFRVTAFNQYGESDASDREVVVTGTNAQPNAPQNVRAIAISEILVRITWTDGGLQDSFVIQRHDTINTGWVQIGSVPDNTTLFNDSTVALAHKYFYRVGAKDTSITVWSTNIDSVRTPTIGVPVPPVDLTANPVIGLGVMLSWRDMSSNETGFEIFRNLFGQVGSIIDTVPAGSVTYTDTLGTTMGRYAYQVRAFNPAGNSSWSNIANADYRYISRGIIPVAVGNWWEYSVDSAGTQFSTRRTIVHPVFHNGQDFYLMTERSGGSLTDSSVYLRNNPNEGCMMLHFPLLPNDNPQLLFRYPAVTLQDSYYVDGQIVEVVVASPGQSLVIGDSVYTHVLVFDRFFSPSHWIQYYIKPETHGIIRELEYTGSRTSPVLVATRNLRSLSIVQ
jgi:hypothetical protein